MYIIDLSCLLNQIIVCINDIIEQEYAEIIFADIWSSKNML